MGPPSASMFKLASASLAIERVINTPPAIRHKKYVHVALGFNYRMTEMQALLGREQLKLLNNQVKKRNKIAKDLFTTKYRKRIVKPKKGKGSFRRKKR